MNLSMPGRGKLLSLSLVALAAACSSKPADTTPSRSARVAPGTDGQSALPSARGGAPLHVLVQLTERPTTVAYRGRFNTVALDGSTVDAAAAATDAAVQQLANVTTEQAAFSGNVEAAGIPGTTELYRLQRVYNGIVYVTDQAGLARLRALPGARAVHELPLHEADNASGVPLVGAPQLWSLGVPVKGDGIKIGVIDTGIDYLHSNFGGPGTEAAFDANDPNLVEPGSFPTAKVVGGWDFAGGAYNAQFDATSFPMPDADPLDRSGHGSHVAGTAAGFGVRADGTTYPGPYDLSLDPTTLRIGPGSAPLAQLYALKVFGDGGGSTALSALAVEWATDPNGDGNFSDHLDVINLSLGSAYGSPSDTEAIFYTNAVNAGVVVVASAGNNNDVYFITGSPGATPAVISVAATSAGTFAAVRINAPPTLAGLKAAGTTSFGPATWAAVTADLAATSTTTPVSTSDGCAALPAGSLTGKIALIARGTCNVVVKTKNAQDAGAVAVLVTNNVAGDPPSFSGVDPTVIIPTRTLSLADGNLIRAALAAGEVVNATIDDFTIIQDATKVDSVASFTSRGPTRLLGAPMLKPDVAAPGVGVISTAMGTGSGSASFNGTSMAAPLTAGVMALLKQLHPTWTPAELKALLMNTATHDVFNLPTTSPTRLRIGPGRVGAGRIDAALASAGSVVAYDKAAPERVSVSFATIDVAAPLTETRTIAVKNKGAADVTYDVTLSSAVTPPGVTVTVGAPTVTVTAGATADLALALAADPAAMVRGRDPTTSTTGATPFGSLARNWLSEASGWVVLTPQGGGATLRVPYFAAPVPASALAASSPLATSGAAGTATVTLAGTGVDTRALAAAPLGVVSLTTPFELAYASPRAVPLGGPLPVGYPSAEADIANLRYVGITSNVADLGGDITNAEIYLAINTWAPWGTPQEVEFDVYLRKAGAPAWEYVLFNWDAGRLGVAGGALVFGGAYADVHMPVLQNLATGSLSVPNYLNGISANQFSVPLLLSDTMVLPFFAADVAAPGGSAIEYQVVAFSNRFGLVDSTPVLTYDLLAPAFSTTIDPALTTLGPGYTPFRVGADGATFPVAYDLDRARATSTGSLLLIHHHNATGQRAQVVPVQGLSCAVAADCAATPATPVCDVAAGACVGCMSNADCASGYCDVYGSRTCMTADCRTPGGPICPAHYACSLDYGTCQPNQALIATLAVPPSTACPAGGLQVNTGFDDNQNGALNAEEVLSTSYVCNGQSASVAAEPAGANCATGGIRVQVGTGAATYVCNGTNGVDGQSATVTSEPAGANCATGGIRVQVGTGTATYVCNGTNGVDGQSATVTPEAAGANCPNGGLRVQVGAGTPAYVCDGAPGSNGTDGQSATVTPEPAGANCADGGLMVVVGTGTPTYVCNGADGAVGPTGPTGPTGPVGPKGSSGCSSVGGGSSALSLVGLGALLWRRRRTVKPAGR